MDYPTIDKKFHLAVYRSSKYEEGEQLYRFFEKIKSELSVTYMDEVFKLMEWVDDVMHTYMNALPHEELLKMYELSTIIERSHDVYRDKVSAFRESVDQMLADFPSDDLRDDWGYFSYEKMIPVFKSYDDLVASVKNVEDAVAELPRLIPHLNWFSKFSN